MAFENTLVKKSSIVNGTAYSAIYKQKYSDMGVGADAPGSSLWTRGGPWVWAWIWPESQWLEKTAFDRFCFIETLSKG